MANSPHLHIPKLVLSKDSHPLRGINKWLAIRVTNWVGTMYMAYLFAVIAGVALPQAWEAHSLTVLVNWISSNFIQLVLLPIIIVGQKVSAAASDARAEADHATLTAIHEINVQQSEILKNLDALAKAQK